MSLFTNDRYSQAGRGRNQTYAIADEVSAVQNPAHLETALLAQMTTDDYCLCLMGTPGKEGRVPMFDNAANGKLEENGQFTNSGFVVFEASSRCPGCTERIRRYATPTKLGYPCQHRLEYPPPYIDIDSMSKIASISGNPDEFEQEATGVRHRNGVEVFSTDDLQNSHGPAVTANISALVRNYPHTSMLQVVIGMDTGGGGSSNTAIVAYVQLDPSEHNFAGIVRKSAEPSILVRLYSTIAVPLAQCARLPSSLQ